MCEKIVVDIFLQLRENFPPIYLIAYSGIAATIITSLHITSIVNIGKLLEQRELIAYSHWSLQELIKIALCYLGCYFFTLLYFIVPYVHLINIGYGLWIVGNFKLLLTAIFYLRFFLQEIFIYRPNQ